MCNFTQMCSHLLKEFLTEKFIFCALICASKLTDNYCGEENNLFFEKLLLLYSHFMKSHSIFLPLGVQMQCFETFCILFVWSSIDSIGIFFLAGRKCVDLVVIFNKERKETFAVSFQNRKSCVCIKYLTLAQTRKLIAMNFTFSYLM